MARDRNYRAVLQWDNARIAALVYRPERDGLAVVEHVQSPRRSTEASADLAAFISEHDLAGLRVYTLFPREDSSVRYHVLPSTDPAELDGMSRYAAEELTPLRPEETTVYHRVLGEAGPGESQVLICVVQTKRLDAHLDLLAKAGIYPEQIFLSTDCVDRALGAVAPGTEPVLAIDAQGDRADLVLTVNGYPVLDRGVPLPSDTDAVLGDAFVRDVRRTLASVASGQTVRLLTGGDAEARRRLTEALRSLELEAVAGTLSPTVADASGALKGLPLSLLGACLLAGNAERTPRGLLPASEIRKRKAGSMRRTASIAGIAALVAITALAILYGVVVRDRTRYIATLESRIDTLMPEARAVAEKRRQLSRLNSAVRSAADPHLVLTEVMEQAPETGLNLSHFRYDIRDGVEVRGRAVELVYVDEFLDNLTRRGSARFAAFSRATEIYRTVRTELNEQVWDFAIAIPFEAAESEGSEESR